jgi:cellular nucleic acid-binding protein
MSSSSIYILRLQGGFYYIGRSSNVMERYAEHVEGRGSSWTALHKPISILRTIPNCSNFDEDKYVKEYMAKYGIDMVRGGAYSNCELNDEQIRLLEREILGASDKCYNCGRKGHFAHDCRVAAPAAAAQSSNCKRCGRTGHVEKNCYATKDIHGGEIDYESDEDDEDDEDDDDACYRCGRDGHYARDCYAKRDINGDKIYD